MFNVFLLLLPTHLYFLVYNIETSVAYSDVFSRFRIRISNKGSDPDLISSAGTDSDPLFLGSRIRVDKRRADLDLKSETCPKSHWIQDPYKILRMELKD